MNSGLYAFAGASATATAAACANLLLDPMTKVSKVYFGFSRAGSTGAPRDRSAQPGGGGGAGLSGAWGFSWRARWPGHLGAVGLLELVRILATALDRGSAVAAGGVTGGLLDGDGDLDVA